MVFVASPLAAADNHARLIAMTTPALLNCFDDGAPVLSSSGCRSSLVILPSFCLRPGNALDFNALFLAAIVGMFFSNQFADRNFAAENFASAISSVAGDGGPLAFTESFGRSSG